MTFTHAGLYGTDSVTDVSGTPLPEGTPATVHIAGTLTLAALFTDRDKTSMAANPVLLIDAGMLKFWANPGLYDITVLGYTYEADVGVDATDIASVGSAASLGSATPLALAATAAVGTSPDAPHEDHVHPSTGLVTVADAQTVTGAKTFTATTEVDGQLGVRGYVPGPYDVFGAIAPNGSAPDGDSLVYDDGGALYLTGTDYAGMSFAITSDVNYPNWFMARSKGTPAAPTGVLAGDWLGQLRATGRHSSGYSGDASGLVGFRATETHTVSSRPTEIVLQTTAPGSIAPVDRLVIAAGGQVTATAGLVVGGPVATAYRAVTAAAAIADIDSVIDATSGTFTVTLPTAVGITGRHYTVKNSGAGTVTLATTSSQTIDGATTKTLAVQYGFVSVISDGANWKIVATG